MKITLEAISCKFSKVWAASLLGLSDGEKPTDEQYKEAAEEYKPKLTVEFPPVEMMKNGAAIAEKIAQVESLVRDIYEIAGERLASAGLEKASGAMLESGSIHADNIVKDILGKNAIREGIKVVSGVPEPPKATPTVKESNDEDAVEISFD